MWVSNILAFSTAKTVSFLTEKQGKACVIAGWTFGRCFTQGIQIFLEVGVAGGAEFGAVGGIVGVQAACEFPRVRDAIVVGVGWRGSASQDGPAVDVLFAIDYFAGAVSDFVNDAHIDGVALGAGCASASKDFFVGCRGIVGGHIGNGYRLGLFVSGFLFICPGVVK